MKKQKIRFYAALLCSSMVLSLVSTPVSAAETGQLTNPPTSTEGPGSPESASGNEAAAILNGLYTTLPVANGVKEVATAEELAAALADSSISGITLKGDVEISSTLTVNRTVTLDLNGNVLKMTGGFSVIKVESGGDLTIADSTPNKVHKFNPNYTDMWGCGLWKLDKDTGTEIVSGGVITGGGGDFAHSDGGGVLVNVGGKLTMTGGSIVGCSAGGLGGGVHLAYDSSIGKSSTFTMTGGSIIGCAAQLGGGVYVTSGCTFVMATSSNIHNCIANNDGGGVINHGTFQMRGGTISTCTTVAFGGGGVCNNGTFIMSDGMIKGCTSPDGQYASGGGVRNSNQFTMTGGMIGDPDNENDASHVYNTSSQETTLTISGNAKIYTDITNVGILNADGGEIAGTMTNDTNRYGTGSEGAAGSTEFHGKVTNTGTIRKGTFKNEVINESSGTINGGTFTGAITNNDGMVLDGDFSGATLNGMLVITFDPNNGDQPSTQKVNWSKDGAALTAPDPVPTNEGHSIEGWYYDNNGTETKWNFDTDTVKCTMTLKAKWELSTYSVTLQTDGGTIASGKEVTGYTYGTGAVLPTTNDITREGYRFDGWYADSNFSGSPVTEITGTDTENKTFYAKWTKNTTPIISGNTINYIVEHYKTDGSGYTLAETEHSAGKTGDTVTATPKTYEGFTYNPAISTASGTLKKISGPEDIVTLKLYYDMNADTEQESTDNGPEEKADRENPSPVVKKNPSYMTYTVQAGDTLWAIARKYNCSITEIVAANSDRIKNPNRIHAGWQLKIPQSGAPITGGTPDAVLPENKKSGIYIVRQGDTLWAIARKCGCSVAEIVSLNRELIRNPALIHSGWKLKVPQD
ncbi:MAG: LysM peptidoglycan-binding domain-containing protein [Waltera sp.]|uniref:LysM peptidoglycan-binding domain-containing protein n=1 Tax=Waltera sp. TaxID=2815806 RepID=UPI0039930F34